MAETEKTFMIEDARIIFLNFEGKEARFNDSGDRNFAVVLDPDTANQMLQDGWNVKILSAREEDEDDTFYIPVKVRYDVRPPRVTLISSTGRTILDEDSVKILDSVDIAKVDLIARGFDWSVNGKSGTKAYLKTMFVTISEDALEMKYGAV